MTRPAIIVSAIITGFVLGINFSGKATSYKVDSLNIGSVEPRRIPVSEAYQARLRKSRESIDSKYEEEDSSLKEMFRGLLSEEELASSIEMMGKFRVSSDYLPLCHMLGLSEEESSEFIDLMNSAFFAGFASVTESQSGNDSLMETARHFESNTRSSLSRVEEFLTDEQYSDFVDYQKNTRVRQVLETFAGKSLSMGIGLDEDEYDEILSVLMEADQYDQENIVHASNGERVWLGYDSALSVLGESLKGEQVSLLKSVVGLRIGELKAMEGFARSLGTR